MLDRKALYKIAEREFVDRYADALEKRIEHEGLIMIAEEFGLTDYLIEMRKRYGKFPRLDTVINRLHGEQMWLHYEALSEVEE